MAAPRKNSILTAIVKSVAAALRGSVTGADRRDPVSSTVRKDAVAHGAQGDSVTREINPPAPGDLRITYAPDKDGAPDAGEIVWTWVPYEENDGRGKDRPVLVIGRDGAERAYAVRLTSKSHDGDRDFLSIGSGAWDAQGRESWVDIEQVYSIHKGGMRREAAVLDLTRFARVARALQLRYGWAAGA